MRHWEREFLGGVRRTPIPDKNFTMIDNHAVRFDALDFRALGLLLWLLSHQSGFKVSERSIVAARREGRAAIRAALAQLEEAGFLVREQRRLPSGAMADPEYRVTDNPTLYNLARKTAGQSRGLEIEPRSAGPDTDDLARKTAGQSRGPEGDTPAVAQNRRSEPWFDSPTSVNRTTKEDQPTEDEEENDAHPSGRPKGLAGVSPDARAGAASPRPNLSPRIFVFRSLPAELVTHAARPLPKRPPKPLADLIDDELNERTPEQLAARITRRWVEHGYEDACRSADGSGLGTGVGVAMALLREGECADRRCEDGTNLDSNQPCERCVDHLAARRRARAEGLPMPERTPSQGRTAVAACAACDVQFRNGTEPPPDGVCADCRAEMQRAAWHVYDGPPPATAAPAQQPLAPGTVGGVDPHALRRQVDELDRERQAS